MHPLQTTMTAAAAIGRVRGEGAHRSHSNPPALHHPQALVITSPKFSRACRKLYRSGHKRGLLAPGHSPLSSCNKRHNSTLHHNYTRLHIIDFCRVSVRRRCASSELHAPVSALCHHGRFRLTIHSRAAQVGPQWVVEFYS